MEGRKTGNKDVFKQTEEGLSLWFWKKQKLTPRMTEKSHKKRSVVIYEIKNGGVALEGAEEVPSVRPSDCSRRPGAVFVTLCTFFMPLESVNLKLFHEGF